MKKEIKIVVPTQWSAITLRKYLDLQKDLKVYGENEEGYTACLMHHLCDFNLEYLSQLDTETFTHIKNDLVGFMGKTDFPLQKFITINGIEYGFEPNLSKMAYGAYLDIAKYDTFTINEDWAKIMSILYRPVIGKSAGSPVFFCSFINGLTELYPEIFDGFGGDTSQHQINFGKKWKNYSSVIQLANGDIRLMDDITGLPLEKCLLFLAYQSDYNQLQNLLHKEVMAKTQR